MTHAKGVPTVVRTAQRAIPFNRFQRRPKIAKSLHNYQDQGDKLQSSHARRHIWVCSETSSIQKRPLGFQPKAFTV